MDNDGPDYSTDPQTLKWRTVPLILTKELAIGGKLFRPEQILLDVNGNVIGLIDSVGRAEQIVSRYNDGLGQPEVNNAPLLKLIRELRIQVATLHEQLAARKSDSDKLPKACDGRGKHGNHRKTIYRLANGKLAQATGTRDPKSRHRPMKTLGGGTKLYFMVDGRRHAYLNGERHSELDIVGTEDRKLK